MRRIDNSTIIPIVLHQEIVENKKNSSSKERLMRKMPQTRFLFKNYNKAFSEDTLADLTPQLIDKQEKHDQQSLYDFRKKEIKDLFTELTTRNGHEDVLCPCCMINDANSFDHYLPQSEFPEYIDHSLNLIPCCTECNGHKSANWREEGQRYYINLYIDDIPKVQYLFVNFSIEGDTLSYNFYLDNRNGIEENLYTRLVHFYNDLHLCERFKRRGYQVVTELAIDIKRAMTYIPKKRKAINAFRKRTISDEIKHQEYYGYNYWKSVLRIACCEDNDAFNYIISH